MISQEKIACDLADMISLATSRYYVGNESGENESVCVVL